MSSLSWPIDAPRHGGIVLRPFRDDDVDLVQDLARDPYVSDIGTVPPNASEEQARTWIRGQSPRLLDLIGFSFCIADATTDEGLGQANLWSRDFDEGRATVGYYVAPRARGRGVAADALRALTDFGFTLPGVVRLEAYVEPWNAASIRTCERSGYTREGVLRGRQPIAGEHRDVVLFSRLVSDPALATSAREHGQAYHPRCVA